MRGRRQLHGEGGSGLEGFRKDLSDRVQRLRKERGWSQAQLGERLGKSKTQVFRLEGQQVPTTLGVIEELAAAFDLSMPEFLYPLLEPGAAHTIAREAEADFVREVRAWADNARSQLLGNLNSDLAMRVLDAVARLHRAKASDLEVVALQLECLAREREHQAHHAAGYVPAWDLPSGEEEVDGEAR